MALYFRCAPIAGIFFAKGDLAYVSHAVTIYTCCSWKFQTRLVGFILRFILLYHKIIPRTPSFFITFLLFLMLSQHQRGTDAVVWVLVNVTGPQHLWFKSMIQRLITLEGPLSYQASWRDGEMAFREGVTLSPSCTPFFSPWSHNSSTDLLRRATNCAYS